MNKQMLRRFIYFVTKQFDRSFVRIKPHIFVLCYHDISDAPWRFSIPETMFKKQMEYLLARYTPLTMKQLEDHIYGRNPITTPGFVIAFDDGYKSILSVAKYCASVHITPTVFLLSDSRHANRFEMDNMLELLTPSDIRTLKKHNWDLQSHGATHADFYKINETQAMVEIDGSKKALEKQIRNVTYIAYPKGAYNETVLSQVKKSGYVLGLTMDDGYISKQTNPLLVPRVGVDGSHSFEEFTSLFLPTSIFVRGLLRKLPFGKSI